MITSTELNAALATAMLSSGGAHVNDLVPLIDRAVRALADHEEADARFARITTRTHRAAVEQCIAALREKPSAGNDCCCVEVIESLLPADPV